MQRYSTFPVTQIWKTSTKDIFPLCVVSIRMSNIQVYENKFWQIRIYKNSQFSYCNGKNIN